MPGSKSFAELFRQSKFVQFDPKIPRIYTSAKVPPTTVPGRTTAPPDRPAFFGFKRDLHPTHYGRPLTHLQMRNLDGRYGLPTLRSASDKLRMHRVMSELQRLLGASGHHQTMLSNFSDRPVMGGGLVRVPGRVLNRLSGGGGYAVGVGGVVAELPASEVPPMQHFSNADIAERRAFYFYVRRAEFDAKGRPKVVLSLCGN